MTRRRAAYVALGANLPHGGLEGAALLGAALAEMRARGLAIRRVSSAWASAAWPEGGGQPDYVNAAAEIDPGGLSPHELLSVLLNIERQFGRERRERWAARSLDLDIVDFDGLALESEDLTLPHPRMHARAFVLAPLLEIAPDWAHPTLGPGEALLARAEGQVRKVGALGPPSLEGRG